MAFVYDDVIKPKAEKKIQKNHPLKTQYFQER